MIRIRMAIALAALFLASPAVAEEGATTGDLRLQCLSRDPILHQHCLSYIAGVYEMTVGEVQLNSFELVSFGSSTGKSISSASLRKRAPVRSLRAPSCDGAAQNKTR